MLVKVVKGPVVRNAYELAAFEQLAETYLPGIGFPYDPTTQEIKGQNAATGEVNYDAKGTERWDTQKIHTDGEGYWISPSTNPNYVDWKEHLALMGVIVESVEVDLEIPDGVDS